VAPLLHDPWEPSGDRTFTAKYGVVGLSVVQKEFIAEGSTKRGCRPDSSSFRNTEGYEPYEPAQNDRTLAGSAIRGMGADAIFDRRRGQSRRRRRAHRRVGKDVGRTLAHRRTVRTAGRAGNRRRSAAFLRKRGRCAHQRPRFRMAAHQPEQLREPLSGRRPRPPAGRRNAAAYGRQFGVPRPSGRRHAAVRAS